MIFQKKIIDLQPSQLYISKSKLFNVESWMLNKIESYNPIPIKLLDDKLVITDGHTRLYVLFQLGYQNARIVMDEDDLDWEAYKVYVQWCLESGIYSVKDLMDKTLDDFDYNKLWIDRCKEMHDKLLK